MSNISDEAFLWKQFTALAVTYIREKGNPATQGTLKSSLQT